MEFDKITVFRQILYHDNLRRYATLTLLYVLAHLWLLCAALPITGRPRAGPDPLTYELGGQFLATGRLPYIELFDIRPPFAHIIPGILAMIIHTIGRPGFGHLDALLLHVASMLLTILTTLGALLLISDIVYEMTEDALAALTAGLVPCVFPFFYMQGITGFRPKAVVVVTGLLTLRWLHHERWLWAGIVATVASLLWQFGLIFPLLAVGVARRRDREALVRVLAGCSVATMVALAPFVFSGVTAFHAILTEVIFLPFIVRPVRETGTLFADAIAVVSNLGWPAFCVTLVGAVGAMVVPWHRRIVAGGDDTLEPATKRLAVWVSVVVVWFSIQVLLVDGGGLTDPVVWVAFVAIGVGSIIAQFDNDTVRRLLVGIIVGVVVVIFATRAFDAFYNWRWTMQPEPAFQRVSTVYWRDVSASTCHLRRAGDEMVFVRLMEGQLSERVCGQYTLETLLRMLFG